MYVVIIKQGLAVQPKTTKDMKDAALGLFKYADCFIGKNYSEADAFIIRTQDVMEAQVFETVEQAKAYAEFVKATKDFKDKEVLVKELNITLNDIK